MLRTSGPPVKPEIQRAIDSILKEDSNFDRVEARSAHRENLVRAVMIKIRESESQITAFSRNISATGVGLITGEMIQERSSGILKIAQLVGPDLSILADCRWCKPYGDSWFLSGWQFIALKR